MEWKFTGNNDEQKLLPDSPGLGLGLETIKLKPNSDVTRAWRRKAQIEKTCSREPPVTRR